MKNLCYGQLLNNTISLYEDEGDNSVSEICESTNFLLLFISVFGCAPDFCAVDFIRGFNDVQKFLNDAKEYFLRVFDAVIQMTYVFFRQDQNGI
jgi:hypothetical protein